MHRLNFLYLFLVSPLRTQLEGRMGVERGGGVVIVVQKIEILISARSLGWDDTLQKFNSRELLTNLCHRGSQSLLINWKKNFFDVILQFYVIVSYITCITMYNLISVSKFKFQGFSNINFIRKIWGALKVNEFWLQIDREIEIFTTEGYFSRFKFKVTKSGVRFWIDPLKNSSQWRNFDKNVHLFLLNNFFSLSIPSCYVELIACLFSYYESSLRTNETQ